MATRIIQEHPGYYWQWDGYYWQIRWQPVHQWYSPPCLHPSVQKQDIRVPMELQDKIGLLIGHQGRNFVRITQQTGCYYIFYLSVSNTIEVWGEPSAVVKAVQAIYKLISRISLL